ncbi:MAG: autotransporter outer membrane beta-barrel domain-containing protein [Alphaproteobacteria bacterium]|nr:autotransporter outer membrane beta-barrel domain-containing protein [Alphaproteobacteria bacterium]
MEGRFFQHNGFTETGASSLNLSSGGERFSQGSLIAGLTIDGDYRVGGVRLQPSHSIAYERIIGEALPSANLTLAGSPTGFAVRGPNESRNRLRLDTALEVDLSDRATIDLSNSGVISTDRSDVSGNAVFKIRF